MTTLAISVVIPAHNAAETLSETIQSLLAQTYPNWQAIIVDDGSKDNTAAIATTFAAQDTRIQVVSQSQSGVCAARNRGVELAQFDWLLFLDADDWIAPHYFERVAAKLQEYPTLDAVHCGYVRVAPDGFLVGEKHAPSSTDLFATLARCCPFAMHTCVVKKSIFQQVGGFDTSLITCEDWDLWQRIARRGVCFGGIPEVLAFYRMRAQSLSSDGRQFLMDGLRVLRQGHAPDPRVPDPDPDHKDGRLVDDSTLNSLLMDWMVWPAGLVVGLGKDATPLLQLLDGNAPDLNPYIVASNLFESAALPTCCPPQQWWRLWQDISPSLQQFLVALEHTSESKGLARRVTAILERTILENAADIPLPIQIGHTYGILLEVTQPIETITSPTGVDRLYAYIQLEGELLGAIELPICDGQVAPEVLVDAIAAKFSWPILGRFFQHTVYPPTPTEELERLHEQIGWHTFLQQLWNRGDWSGDCFYDASYAAPSPIETSLEQPWITLDISEELPDVLVNASELMVSFTVGGVPLGGFAIPVVNHRVTAQAMRVALTLEGGLELCIAVVREALIGQALTHSVPLWQRLANRAQHRQAIASASPISTQLPYSQHSSLGTAMIVGRKAGAIGTNVSRRAMLPVAAVEALQEGAIALHELIQLPDGVSPAWGLYAPEWYTPESLQQHRQDQQTQADRSIAARSIQIHHHNRNHFETLFAIAPDPWKYTSDYEQIKYEQTLSLVPPNKINKVLELACAEGHFTVQLAPKVNQLLAADISQIALERTAERCKQFKHISYKRLDLVTDEIPGSFELIICSEVLYYVGDKSDLKKVAHKMMNALEPGGYLLMAHAHAVVDEPDRTGFDWAVPFGAKGISDTFSNVPELRLVKEIWTPLYRVQLFQRTPKFELLWQRPDPQRIQITEQPAVPLPQVAARIRWQGGQPEGWETPPITAYEEYAVTTERLPILMYHRIAPTGAERMTCYRVTPQAFEQQLQYLRDAGYYGVSFETWRKAAVDKKPLPGRAIILTFDDGYQDFHEYAAPLLKQYGFSATVFLVTDYVGRSNSWDHAYGELLPLMDWKTIQTLHTEGIEFGSHTCSHSPLTSLPPAEIVKEAVRSRTILSQQLGVLIQTIAYPYGDVDTVVQHLFGACGYTFGVTCRSGLSQFRDPLLALPRIEVMGSDSLAQFIAKLSPL